MHAPPPSFLMPQSLEFHVCVFGLAACICITNYHSRILQAASQYFVTCCCHSVSSDYRWWWNSRTSQLNIAEPSECTHVTMLCCQASHTKHGMLYCTGQITMVWRYAVHKCVYWTSNNGVTVYRTWMYFTGQVTMVRLYTAHKRILLDN